MVGVDNSTLQTRGGRQLNHFKQEETPLDLNFLQLQKYHLLIKNDEREMGREELPTRKVNSRNDGWWAWSGGSRNKQSKYVEMQVLVGKK